MSLRLDPDDAAWSPDEIRAMQHPSIAEELERLGVLILRTFGRVRPFVPAEHEAYVRSQVAAVLARDAPGVVDHLGPQKTARYGKDYPGELVEEVVRQAHTAAVEHGVRLGRTLRNKLHGATGASTYAVDAIFRLMEKRPPVLADAGRKGWLKVAGVESATPSFINLYELENRS